MIEKEFRILKDKKVEIERDGKLYKVFIGDYKTGAVKFTNYLDKKEMKAVIRVLKEISEEAIYG